jgi:hypothetical protein
LSLRIYHLSFRKTVRKILAENMYERDQFHCAVKLILKPVLIADGFRASRTTYRRTLGEVIHIVALQGSPHGGQCCVNLGIHLAFLPLVGSAEACDFVRITERECEFRSRLAPTGQCDFWWSYGSTEHEAQASAESILRLYRDVGVPYFGRFTKFPDDFVHVTPSMLSNGSPLRFPSGGTFVRRALALSRIALHTGRIAEAKQFAEIGLAHLGRAKGLENEFRNMLAVEERE